MWVKISCNKWAAGPLFQAYQAMHLLVESKQFYGNGVQKNLIPVYPVQAIYPLYFIPAKKLLLEII